MNRELILYDLNWVFDRRMLRGLLNLRGDGGLRGRGKKLHTEKLLDLFTLSCIIGQIQSGRIRCSGHVKRMGEIRKAYKILISRFRRDVDETYALLGYYTASSGNPLPTFRDKKSKFLRLTRRWIRSDAMKFVSFKVLPPSSEYTNKQHRKWMYRYREEIAQTGTAS